MRRYDKIKTFDIDNMAWFIQTIINDTEDNMLNKLAEYGIDVSMVRLDENLQHLKILNDLEVEDDS